MINGYPSANIATVNGNIAIASGLDDAEWEKTNPSTSNKMSITFKGYCFTYTEAATLGNEPSISSVQAAPCL